MSTFTQRSEAKGISLNGQVIVGSSSSAHGTQAFRWTEADGMIGLGDLPGGNYFSVAHDTSADGSVIVGESDSGRELEAFRWSQDTGIEPLGVLPGYYGSMACAASGNGSIIVGRNYTDQFVPYRENAFIWTQARGMRSIEAVLTSAGIDMTGWELYAAYDVSAAGNVIVGDGINPDGNREAWLAVIPVPEPPTIWMSVFGYWLCSVICSRWFGNRLR